MKNTNNFKQAIKHMYLSIICIFFCSCFSYGQFITSLEIVPENPTTADELFLVTHLSAFGQYNPPDVVVENNGTTINVAICFYKGGYVPIEETHYYDTISLGFVNTGSYNLNYSLSSTFSEQGCTENDVEESEDFSFFVDRYLSTKELTSSTITLFPNPTNGKVKIKSDQTIDDLEIYDISGRKIKRFNFNSTNTKKYQIDISNFRNGVYLFVIQNENYRLTRKVVKK